MKFGNDILAATGRGAALPAPMRNPWAWRTRPPLWLPLLFALYGPSLDIVGEVRYVEIVLLVLLLLNFGAAIRSIGRTDWLFVWMFLLAGVAQIVSDVINDAALSGTWKRSGTYFILALLIIVVKWLSRGERQRLLLIVGGFSVSFVTALYIGSSTSAHFSEMPWRLGLGMAVSTFTCVLIAYYPWLAKFGVPALLALAAFHVHEQARSLAILTAITGILMLIAQARGTALPAKFRPRLVFLSVVGGIGAVVMTWYGLRFAMEYELLPEELQQKMELQASNPYGILAAGRPDTVAALYGIWKSPLIGFGSTNVDRDVYAFYVELTTSSYMFRNDYSSQVDLAWKRVWELGTPSHSHIFGAWVDAGIFAAFGWFVAVFVSGYVLARALIWRNPIMPLVVLVALTTLWDVFFSPGPQRMEMAVNLVLLTSAIEMFRTMDKSSLQPKLR